MDYATTNQEQPGGGPDPQQQNEEEVVFVVKTPPPMNEAVETSDQASSIPEHHHHDLYDGGGGGRGAESTITTTNSHSHSAEMDGLPQGKAPQHVQATDKSETMRYRNESSSETTTPVNNITGDGRMVGNHSTSRRQDGENNDGNQKLMTSGGMNNQHQEPQGKAKVRKRNHIVRTPTVQDLVEDGIGGSRGRKIRNKMDPKVVRKGRKVLPAHQYETTLIRRAIRKGDFGSGAAEIYPFNNNNNRNGTLNDGNSSAVDLYGDVSLGMQLAPVGGKIIVQGLISLKDGRASPAQLAGCIQRGDVLLQINNRSLVNIPFDQLMQSLTPLSSPLSDGTYPRKITLRFAAGQGLELIKRKEQEDQFALRQRKALTEPPPRSKNGSSTQQQQDPNSVVGGNVDGAADILGLFTMVDQLSGMPMFEDNNYRTPSPVAVAEEPEEERHETTQDVSSTKQAEASLAEKPVQEKRIVPLEEAISTLIAKERHAERDESDSEFFSWNEAFSVLLRRPQQTTREIASATGHVNAWSKDGKTATSELLELGHKAFDGAQKLSAILEKIDRGWSDRHSIRSLSATLSLYSRASTRRRYTLDNRAMPVNFEQVEEDDEDSMMAASDSQDKADSKGSDAEEEELNNDELMIQLAAKDESWKEQLIEFLDDLVEKLNNPDEQKQSQDLAGKEEEHGAAAAVSTELGSFLFGDGMTKALMLHKKPQALPPDEITALLFDLANNVSATIPDQVQVVSVNTAVQPSLPQLATTRRTGANSDVFLASRFLLDDVLPVWLKTFRPLPWTQRRVLWPLERTLSTESTTVGSTRSDDSITVDSMGTKQQRSRKRKPANLREQIENQELNAETRAETCFLVTFYFTRKVLLQLSSKDPDDTSNESAVAMAKQFVKEYGSYLRLHSSLTFASALKRHEIISVLVEMAKHDPLHRESVRRFSRSGSLLFYEPSVLSAVVSRLHDLHLESDQDQKLLTIHLCASAYPDVRPWQVFSKCRDSHQDLYYKYLSYLLHPSDGHELARRDATLVMEWASLSAHGYTDHTKRSGSKPNDAKEKKRNFYSVVSKTSSDHLAYTRDLPALLRLTMEVKDFMLALDIVYEIFDDPSKSKSKFSFNSLISNLRTISRAAVESFDSKNQSGMRTLKRIIRLFQRADGTGIFDDGWRVDGSAEIRSLLNYASETFGISGRHRLIPLVRFFADEASPKEVLLALSKFCTDPSKRLSPELYEFLRIVLQRGAHESQSMAELSKSLRRVKEARVVLISNDSSWTSVGENLSGNVFNENGLWKKMAQGALPIAK